MMSKHGNPEGCIQLQILHYCKARGYNIGKIKNKGSRVGNRFIFDQYQFLGLPDLLLFTPKMYFIEVKSKTGQQSEHQVAFQNLCNKANIPYILVRNLEDVISQIK
jgi:hypothetical protein